MSMAQQQDVLEDVDGLTFVTLKYAKRLNGLTGLSVNHLDTIGKF